MEKMGETVADSSYQSLHHMLSESNWDRGAVRRQLIADANTCFGHASALGIDESGFGKKGDKSAGVDRQWNGRLGKGDNSQVGLFASSTKPSFKPQRAPSYAENSNRKASRSRSLLPDSLNASSAAHWAATEEKANAACRGPWVRIRNGAPEYTMYSGIN